MPNKTSQIRLPRWTGPALALIGVLVLAYLVLRPVGQRGNVSWWLALEALSYRRILPLAALGAAFALLPRWAGALSFLALYAGLVLGYLSGETLVTALTSMPGDVRNLALVGPLTFALAGLALLPPAFLRRFAIPPAALLFGAAFAVFIRLTDPSHNEAAVTRAGILFALWLPSSVALSLRIWRRKWFDIAAPILGSWLIAIALLYGGATLLPQRRSPSPQPAQPSAPSSVRQDPSRPAADAPMTPPRPPGAGLRNEF